MKASVPFIVFILTAFSIGCRGSPSSPNDADVLVVFIGNSLTLTHDVPELVRSLADRGGLSMAHVTFATGGWSLEEHWHAGVPAEITRLRPDFVVMQQGPSSLPESRVHLIHWSGQFAEVIRAAGGEPVLYTVWPPLDRVLFFPDVVNNYRDAAIAADARLAPAGQTWLEAWSRFPELPLYGFDGFHPSYLGSLAAAQTIFAVLFEIEPSRIPALNDQVDEDTLAILRESVAASIAGSH